MKNLFLAILFAAAMCWPQVQGPAQSPPYPPGERLVVRPEDSITHIKTQILSKMDSISYEINRIAHNHVRYVTRTHIRKVDHYHVDTVLVFIDTCFTKPQLDSSRMIMPEKRELNKKQSWLDRIFHHKNQQRATYLKVVDQ